MRPTSLFALASFLLLALVVGCGDSSSGPASAGGGTSPSGVTKVALQLNWKAQPQFGGFYAAKFGGAYERQKLDVDVAVGGAGIPTVEMLGNGRVEFAIVSGDQLVQARANGIDLVALFAVYQTNPQGIIVPASRGLTGIEQVFQQPGTLAIERGLPYAQFLERKYGFEKLNVIPTPFGDLSGLRRQRDYAMQCFVTEEPIQAKQEGIDVKAFLIADAGWNPYTTVLAARREYVQKNPQVAKAMAAAAREGWEQYLKDPKPTNDELKKLNAGMSDETLAASAAAQVPLILTDEARARGVGTMSAARWEELARQMKDLGAVNKAVPAGELFVDPATLK